MSDRNGQAKPHIPRGFMGGMIFGLCQYTSDDPNDFLPDRPDDEMTTENWCGECWRVWMNTDIDILRSAVKFLEALAGK